VDKAKVETVEQLPPPTDVKSSQLKMQLLIVELLIDELLTPIVKCMCVQHARVYNAM
jgi:hypothetical protein